MVIIPRWSSILMYAQSHALHWTHEYDQEEGQKNED